MLFATWCQLIADLQTLRTHEKQRERIQQTAKAHPNDVLQTLKLMLIREHDKRVFRLGARKLCKVMASLLGIAPDTLRVALEKTGDVAKTIVQHSTANLAQQSTWHLEDLEAQVFAQLATSGTLVHQQRVLKHVLQHCTALEFYWLIKLIQKDLRIGVGTKVVLEAIRPGAYRQWQLTHDLASALSSTPSVPKTTSTAPIKPMLCRVTKSFEDALTRCPNGLLTELKYDGERVQVHWHKDKTTLEFFSRSLKPVTPYKVDPLRPFLAQALSGATSAILDAEVVMMDTQSSKPLPFGTLGKHKRKEHEHAVACLLVFDIMHLNGTSLLSKTTLERRALLKQTLKIIRHRVQLSDALVVAPKDKVALQRAFDFTAAHKLEGLVLKGVHLTYNPGKRHWLKLKRDHLQGMADTADLVPLGSYMGKGKQHGLHAVFLMGCYDVQSKRWKTVCKAGNGFTDDELRTLQTTWSAQTTLIHGKRDAVPEWLHVPNSHVPDAVVVDPWQAPVWEIAGAEFTSSRQSTAGWALRFPRIARVRNDKTPKQATTLSELTDLAEASAAPSTITYTGLSKS